MKKVLRDIIDYLSSVRLTLVILIAVAVVAALGTLAGQNNPPEEYVMRFGHAGYRVLQFLSLTDVFHSAYFNALLMLLVINITLCTLSLAPKRVRDLFRGEKRQPRLALSETLVSRRTEAEAVRIAQKAIGRPFCRTTVGRQGDTTTVTSVPHPVLGLGPIIVHLSVLLIIVGGLISLLFGFSGQMLITEGGRSREVLIKDRYFMKLDFAVRLDRFTLDRYGDGTPREYRSDITFVDGKDEVPATLLVNHPATHRGVRFYQTSFGNDMDHVTVEVLDREGTSVFVGEAGRSETVSVPGRDLTFTVVEYAPEFMDLGPAARLLVAEAGTRYDLWTFVNYPDFDKERGGDYVFVLKDYYEVPYSGITAVKEPGLPLVFPGFILMCVGFLFPIARSMSGFLVRIVARGGRVEVTVSGAPGRLPAGFEERFRRRVQTIRKKLC